MRAKIFLLLLVGVVAQTAHAHVGSKDVYQDVTAGPYKLSVTIRMPNVIPGVAAIEVRSSGAAPSVIEITPLPLVGEASKHPPTADAMQVSSADPSFYTGSLWMMGFGSWQVRFHVTGAAGNATASVPVPATAVSTLRMSRGLGLTLALLGLFLVITMAGIVAAAVGEASMPPSPGPPPPPSRRRRSLVAALSTLGVLALLLWGGSAWWDAEAADYASAIYHPPLVRAALTQSVLDLHVDTGTAKDLWQNPLKRTLLPDHGKLMHLYAIREPEMDAAYHLHPELIGRDDFRMTLPSMEPGTYRLYGDVVHANGFPETLLSTVTISGGLPAAPLAADDASAEPRPLDAGVLGTTYALPDGYSMRWDAPAELAANKAYEFRFTLLDPHGQPAAHLVPYLGMAGHAAFVRSDGTVFAHTHPGGSAAMPAMMLAAGSQAMAAMNTAGTTLPPTVVFPYGFPQPGRYRIFIQMKHDATVETGVFDAVVR